MEAVADFAVDHLLRLDEVEVHATLRNQRVMRAKLHHVAFAKHCADIKRVENKAKSAVHKRPAMMSALRMVDRRCATVIDVVPCMTLHVQKARRHECTRQRAHR